MATAACCKAGPPITSDYQPKGTVEKVGDFEVYRIGGGDKGIIVNYDIFGFSKQTKQVCDKLADAGFNVAMPDFVRGDVFDNENFTQESLSKYPAWSEKHSFDSVIKPDMERVIAHLKEHSGVKEVAVLGFCWGGCMSMKSGATGLFKGCAMVHGAGLSAELAENVTVPLCILPSGEDPEIDDIKAVLDKKPFGSSCVYKRFPTMHHGFCAARGDYTIEAQATAASEAIGIVIDFFKTIL